MELEKNFIRVRFGVEEKEDWQILKNLNLILCLCEYIAPPCWTVLLQNFLSVCQTSSNPFPF